MDVGARVVRVPDFHVGVADRVAARIQNAAADIRDLTHGRSQVAVDHHQIVIRVQRERGRVVGTLGLVRRRNELLCEQSGNIQEQAADTRSGRCFEESAPA